MEFTVRDSIFGVKVHVLLNCSEEDFRKWCKRHGAEDYSSQKLNPNFCGFSTYLTCEEAPDKYLIFINEFNWTIPDQNTLVHEIVHTIFKIWDRAGGIVSFGSQEFFAVTVGKMYVSIAKEIMKRGKRQKYG
jgi:hypothetical protein